MTPVELASASDDMLIAWNFIRIRETLRLTQAQTAALGGATVGYKELGHVLRRVS